MTTDGWDPEQAVLRGPQDEELEGICSPDRYGVTAREELAGEPLSVILSQESPDVRVVVDGDDEWLLVDPDEWESAEPGRCEAPEQAAMHVVTP